MRAKISCFLQLYLSKNTNRNDLDHSATHTRIGIPEGTTQPPPQPPVKQYSFFSLSVTQAHYLACSQQASDGQSIREGPTNDAKLLVGSTINYQVACSRRKSSGLTAASNNLPPSLLPSVFLSNKTNLRLLAGAQADSNTTINKTPSSVR
jgi:hypothetical protein